MTVIRSKARYHGDICAICNDAVKPGEWVLWRVSGGETRHEDCGNPTKPTGREGQVVGEKAVPVGR